MQWFLLNTVIKCYNPEFILRELKKWISKYNSIQNHKKSECW